MVFALDIDASHRIANSGKVSDVTADTPLPATTNNIPFVYLFRSFRNEIEYFMSFAADIRCVQGRAIAFSHLRYNAEQLFSL